MEIITKSTKLLNTVPAGSEATRLLQIWHGLDLKFNFWITTRYQNLRLQRLFYRQGSVPWKFERFKKNAGFVAYSVTPSLQLQAKRVELKVDVRSGSKYKMKSSNMLQKGPIVNMATTESMLFYLFARNYKS